MIFTIFLFLTFCTSNNIFTLSTQIVAGTTTRTEVEFKLAYKLPKNLQVKSLLKKINVLIADSIGKNKYRLEKLTKQPYFLTSEFSSFIFKDIYFDTKNYLLYQNNSSYRLRYRWSHSDLFLRHALFPFIKKYYPSRCEIQYKYGYKIAHKTNIVEVKESRFEFRNESEPFKTTKNAPLAPWPEKIYKNYAKTGKFKQFSILPMYELKKNLPKIKKLPLLEKFTLITNRNRIHLHLKNPFGLPPNPSQTFIITFDVSFSPTIKNSTIILELEIEIERNISTEIERLIDLQKYVSVTDNLITHEAINTAKKYNTALKQDLLTIKTLIADKVNSFINDQPLNPEYKYARFTKMLKSNLKNQPSQLGK